MKKTVCILYGGKSQEHEVSRQSAASIFRFLDRNKFDIICVGLDRDGTWHYQEEVSLSFEGARGEMIELRRAREPLALIPGRGLFHQGKKLLIDVVFPVLHGSFGEDGTLQGLLEMLDLPYAGAGVLASSLAMDKEKAKIVWRAEGLPVVECAAVAKHDFSRENGRRKIIELIESRLDYPVFVKPACAGSSIGVRKVDAAESLPAALEFAFQFDVKVIVERAVQAREIECAVIGNDFVRVFPPGEIIPRHAFYSYEAKYLDPDGASLAIPADLPSAYAERARELATRAYRGIGCSGFARVDLFLEREGGRFYINEINSIPGFTNISMFPRLCAAGGLPYAELIEQLLAYGLERHAASAGLNYKFGIAEKSVEISER